MRRIRLLLAWIMMVAVPLQGFAAASMLLCGPVAGGAVVASGHDHEPGHEHSHGPADDATAHHAAAGHDGGDTPDSQGGMLHKCGVCASCSHAVAITESVHTPGIAIPPQQRIAEPLVVVAFRPVPLPDKPPRA